MIVDKHIEGFVDSMIPDLPEDLYKLEEMALENNVPIIRKSMQQLLKVILLDRKPSNILEIGTAVGFSTLFFEHFSSDTTLITTIEKVEMRLVEARKNLAGHDRIRLIEGDALNVLNDLAINEEQARFDFIFLDAAKGQYPEFLNPIRKLLAPSGMLVTDNVLLEGSIAQSKFTIERRDRTIHKRMREYLYELTHSEDFETVILPVGDGAAISVKK